MTIEVKHVREPLEVSDADVSGSRFRRARLTGAGFDDVNLAGATFTNVDLSGATITNVNLRDATIRDANLHGLRVEGVLIHDLICNARAGAVVFAADLARVAAFYEAVAGLAIERRADDHVVLGSPTFELVVHALPASVAASITIAQPPAPRTDTAVKLVLPVTSLTAARAGAPAHGGSLAPPETEWTTGTHRVCDATDPEGNVIQLRAHQPR